VLDALQRRGLALPTPAETRQPNWRLTATYRYEDEHGDLLYEILRKERGEGATREKKMLARRPDGRGGWVWNLDGVRRVLYRLPEVIEAPIAFICEGEKDCENMRDHGFVATTNPFGASNWDAAFNPIFAKREVIVIPDADPPGWKRGLQIARGVLPYAQTIRVLELGAKDITEWFEAGHSEIELISIVEEADSAPKV
jgi:5S rRNA maturation endonuclease (ribonuclease M5)